MSLNSILDNAWDFLEKSLKDKKAMAEAEAKRLSQIEAEREKTKRMQISSQEKIQLLINKGILDRQELVNQGLLTQKEMEVSGLKDRQESENKTSRDIAKINSRTSREIAGIESRTRLDVTDRENAGAYRRAELGARTSKELADIEARNKWYTIKDYSADGSFNERLVNPNLPPETADPGQLEKLGKKFFDTPSAPIDERIRQRDQEWTNLVMEYIKNRPPAPITAPPPTSGITINPRSMGTNTPAFSSPTINARQMAYTPPQDQPHGPYGLVGNVGPGKHMTTGALPGSPSAESNLLPGYQRAPMSNPYTGQPGRKSLAYQRRMASPFAVSPGDDETNMPRFRRRMFT